MQKDCVFPFNLARLLARDRLRRLELMISEINFLQSTHTSIVLQSSINSLGNSSCDLSTDLDLEVNLKGKRAGPVTLFSSTAGGPKGHLQETAHQNGLDLNLPFFCPKNDTRRSTNHQLLPALARLQGHYLRLTFTQAKPTSLITITTGCVWLI